MNKKRKIIRTFLFVAVCSFWFSCMAFAADERIVSFQPSKRVYKPGDTVEIVICLENIACQKYRINLLYDEDVFRSPTITDTEKGRYMNAKFYSSETAGRYVIGSGGRFNGNGELAVMTFQISEDASEGSYTFDLNRAVENEENPGFSGNTNFRSTTTDLTAVPPKATTVITGLAGDRVFQFESCTIQVSGREPAAMNGAYVVSFLENLKEVKSGGQVEVPICVEQGVYEEAESFHTMKLEVSYDAQQLSYLGYTGAEGFYVDASVSGKLRISRFGEAVSLGEVMRLRFAAVGSALSTAEVSIDSAYVDSAANQNQDMPEASVRNGICQIRVAENPPEKEEISINVTEYRKGKNNTIWLVTLPLTAVSRETGFSMQGQPMYVSDIYQEACFLIANNASQAETIEMALGMLTEETEVPDVLSYQGDVNHSRRVDINDAQYIYELSCREYEVLNDTQMRAMLEADINGDKVLNTQDAQLLLKRLK